MTEVLIGTGLGLWAIWLIWKDVFRSLPERWEKFPLWQRRMGYASLLFFSVAASAVFGGVLFLVALTVLAVRWWRRRPRAPKPLMTDMPVVERPRSFVEQISHLYPDEEEIREHLEDQVAKLRAGEISEAALRQLVGEIEDKIGDELIEIEGDPSSADKKRRVRELERSLKHCDRLIDRIDDGEFEADEPEWKGRQEHNAQFARDGFETAGKWARFDYVDDKGNAGRREITMWERRGSYIVGYDKARKAERTFRQDRIDNWVAG
ncbi:MAG: hypothetical protein BGO57_13255 [Sphingomonadales bacterium 63-6]|nr:MAG: hypothetical protein BGO57_13255 [Sphingomonadales bacterium 63-6]